MTITANTSVHVDSLFDGTRKLKAQLHGVQDEAWRKFVHALSIDDLHDVAIPRMFGARSPSGGYGCFDLRPMRLADLGIMRGVRFDNSSGRRVTVGDFIAPMTAGKFLRSPIIQYNALVESMRRYDKKLDDKLPDGMTRSGVLALLHRLGPRALSKWTAHKEKATVRLFERTNGLF